jgi:hypothetical protein
MESLLSEVMEYRPVTRLEEAKREEEQKRQNVPLYCKTERVIDYVIAIDWIKLFMSFNDIDASFFDPATETKINKIKEMTGIEVSGQLLELLLQTDGIIDIMIT